MSLDNLSFNIQFPLADGRTLVQGPLTYNSDGLATRHNADFIHTPQFAEAYRLAMATGHVFGPDLHVEWRIYTACWIALNASRLRGDFVECGVASGMVSRAVTFYVDWNKLGKTFWLLDTFAGFPTEQLQPEERALGLEARFRTLYDDSFERVKRTFSDVHDVRLVRGKIPDTLSSVTSSEIAYLHLDLNAAAPEMAAIEFFWHRLVPGAWILLDDYGWSEHALQKKEHDRFAARQGAEILSMPTGQGLMIKP
jgi:hypothetical protein